MGRNSYSMIRPGTARFSICQVFYRIISLYATECTRSGMYNLPIMVYLDQDSIEAMAYDSRVVPNEYEAYGGLDDNLTYDSVETLDPFVRTPVLKTKNIYQSHVPESDLHKNDQYALRSDAVDSKTKAEQFLGSIFNEVNQLLFHTGVQLQLVMQQPLNAPLNCASTNPLNSYIKKIEMKHRDATPFTKMFFVFCQNYAPFLETNHGVYQSKLGKDSCTNHIGFMYVNNDILRAKVKRALFSVVSQSKVSGHLNRAFITKTCNYVHRCIDNRLHPVGSKSDFLKTIVHDSPNDLMWDLPPKGLQADDIEVLNDE